jgi:AraC-like DNA-binding protein
MDFAKHLLLRSNMNINQIAESSGFSSSGYFIQSFKRFYGRTPASMRRECMQNVNTE